MLPQQSITEEFKEIIMDAVFSDISDLTDITTEQPLLAHYTSMEVIESIIKNEQIWFSNPLNMNDFEEVRFGITNGLNLIESNISIRQAIQSDKIHDMFRGALRHCYQVYDSDHAFDTYVFCLSEHRPEDEDGILSMWRGYGGNGSGAAIVFDTSQIGPVDDTPLILAKVYYGSQEKRLNWIGEFGDRVADIISELKIKEDAIYTLGHFVFECLKLFSLFSKHDGFKEEKEWRIVYMPDRDKNGTINDMLSYYISDRGVEPKLKFRISPLEGYTKPDISLAKIVHSIILGPTAASHLTRATVKRILRQAHKDDIADRVKTSSIPFRG